jgi:hypothetical protein
VSIAGLARLAVCLLGCHGFFSFTAPLSFYTPPPRNLANQLLLENRKAKHFNFSKNIVFNVSIHEKLKCVAINISKNYKKIIVETAFST